MRVHDTRELIKKSASAINLLRARVRVAMSGNNQRQIRRWHGVPPFDMQKIKTFQCKLLRPHE